MKTVLFVTSQTILQCMCRSSTVVRLVVAHSSLTHTFLVLVAVGLGHRVYRKLYTLIGGQHAENFENHWFKC